MVEKCIVDKLLYLSKNRPLRSVKKVFLVTHQPQRRRPRTDADKIYI